MGPSPPAHPTRSLAFETRAKLPATSPLATYLFQLMRVKRSNVAVSADVTSSRELVQLAEQVGDSICILKTRVTQLSDFGHRTIRALHDIARRKGFLVFEDRDFGGAASSVEKQYGQGAFSIAQWSELTNAHVSAGPSVLDALEKVASQVCLVDLLGIHTEISVGDGSDHDGDDSDTISIRQGLRGLPVSVSTDSVDIDPRMQSVVSVSTTISRTTAPSSSPSLSSRSHVGYGKVVAELGPPPAKRGLLLLPDSGPAECVDAGRQHPGFVVGIVGSRSLNEQAQDNFITISPETTEATTDEVIRSLVVDDGVDIVTFGRQIVQTDDRADAIERYRRVAWKAYEGRVE